MQKTHPNIVVMHQSEHANIAKAVEIITEDAIFHYYNPLLPDMHDDYIGRQGFMDFFEKIAHKKEGTFKVTPLSAIPMGDESVDTPVNDNMVLHREQIEIDDIVVWRIVNGKIKETWDIPAVYTAKTSSD